MLDIISIMAKVVRKHPIKLIASMKYSEVSLEPSKKESSNPHKNRILIFFIEMLSCPEGNPCPTPMQLDMDEYVCPSGLAT